MSMLLAKPWQAKGTKLPTSICSLEAKTDPWEPRLPVRWHGRAKDTRICWRC